MKYKRHLWRLFCLLVATGVIVLFWRETTLIFSLLLILAFLINLKSTKQDIIFYIVVAILATILESITISTGAWTYADPHIFNFPLWLPLYWGMGGLVMKDLYSVLVKEL